MCYKVSVLIPLYNSANYIAETIQSIINQTYKNIELIIVDDGSTDNSYQIAKSFESEHIKVYQQKNKGACIARNYAFELSQGDYIQYLDADDILSSYKIEQQVQALIDHPNHIAVCETWNFTNSINSATNTDTPYLFTTRRASDIFIGLWGGDSKKPNMVQTSAWLTPRSLIEKNGLWDVQLSKDQDGEFFARIALNSQGIIYVPNIKNFYRKYIQGKNISSQKKREHIESNLLSTQLKEKYLFEKTQSAKAKLAIATQYKHVAIEAWPNYKDLAKQALLKCNTLGGSSYSPVLGGKVIESIKYALGWKTAKAFSYYIHKYI